MSAIRKQQSLFQPLYTDSGAVFYDAELLRDKFTFRDKYDKKLEYSNYQIVKNGKGEDFIRLPRALFPLAEGDGDRRSEGSDIEIDLVAEPRNPEQWKAAEDIVNLWNEGNTEFIVEASTGFGKTYLGCVAIWYHQKTALVLITKSDLEYQWRNAFKDFLGLDDDDIGLIQGDHCDIAGKKVVIAYVQSFMKEDRYSDWVYDYFGFVISDEVHLMGADKFSNAMWNLPAMFRMGLTATADRSDGREHVFHSHLGEILLTVELLPMPFNVIGVHTGIIPPKGLWFRPGRMMKFNNWVATHKDRQRIISAAIMKCHEKGRNVVAFADTREHIEFATESLIDLGMKPRKIGHYVGAGSKEEDKARVREEAMRPVVFATYKMTNYGTDFPHWDTAMLMTPRADVRQAVGRVVRLMEGKRTPLVFDFIDSHSILKKMFTSRRRYYDEKAEQVIERSG